MKASVPVKGREAKSTMEAGLKKTAVQAAAQIWGVLDPLPPEEARRVLEFVLAGLPKDLSGIPRAGDAAY